MEFPTNDIQLKALFKSSLHELLRENPELFRGALEDGLEDAGLGRAMEEGRQGEYVAESEIRRLLNS